MNISNSKILIIVTGGIAAYKSANLVSNLKKLGADVKVILTKNAQEFVGKATFEALSQNSVITDMFPKDRYFGTNHISLNEWADFMIVAPATANILGKIANGIADDLASTILLASKKHVFFAPAMNENMYNNFAVQKNISYLNMQKNITVFPTGTGYLACGDYGNGRMLEPEQIIEFIKFFNPNKPLKNKKILVTAGATIEKIDPVRYLTNFSSGKMGASIAKAAKGYGAEVIFIHGCNTNKNLLPHFLDKIISIESTQDLYEKIKENIADIDYLFMAAAPVDYKIKNYSELKIKKSKKLNLEFIENIDILENLGKSKKENQVFIGFALETNNGVENALVKLKKKNLDYIILNNPLEEGAGFIVNTNIIKIISKNGHILDLEKDTKDNLGIKIIENICLIK